MSLLVVVKLDDSHTLSERAASVKLKEMVVCSPYRTAKCRYAPLMTSEHYSWRPVDCNGEGATSTFTDTVPEPPDAEPLHHAVGIGGLSSGSA